MTARRTLHIDIEGGWGGSSRSLFELISRLDRDRIAPLIAHREVGPLVDWYKRIGVPTVHVPEIGSYVPRRGTGLKILLASLPRLRRLGTAAERLAGLASEHGAEVIHLNYEGLFLLANRLKPRANLPMVGHCRALWPEDRWGRWLARSLARRVDRLFFISPQEEGRFRRLSGSAGEGVAGSVMWNIAPEPLPRVLDTERPFAVYFGNLDPSKGTDRMVDIAEALERRGAPPITLKVFGRARSKSSFAAELQARCARVGLADRIELCGYASDPAPILAAATALIRPSRENDPWGRDVIEATRFGVPVLATGSFTGVVEPDVTGYLFDPFDADAVAERLDAMVSQPELARQLGTAAWQKGERQYSGRSQAAEFTDAVETLAQASEGVPAVAQELRQSA